MAVGAERRERGPAMNNDRRKGSRLSRLAAAALALAATSLVACGVGPDYVRPTTEVPPAYKETASWKVARPADTAAKGLWWSAFGDPVLDGLQAQVNLNNQNIAAAEARLRQARAQMLASRAGFFPSLTAGASYTEAVRSQNSISGGSLSGAELSDHLINFQVSWELDLWGKIRRGVEASEASAQASASDLEAARLSAQADLSQAYFQLRALDSQTQLMDQTLVTYRQFLELTKNRYAGGLASMADVAQAETQLKSTQAQSVDLGIQRAQLEHAVALLLGKPASGFSLPRQPLSATLPVIPPGLPSQLLERRPDVAGAERRVAAANAQIGVAKAAFFPSLTLSAAGGYESSLLGDLLKWPSRFWSVGPSLAQSVFDAGLRRAQAEGAQAAYDATVATYRQTVLTAFKEAEDNIASLRILEEEAKVQAEALAASRRSVEITTNQYKAGVTGYLNVLTAQTALLTIERNAVDIAGRRMVASVLLVKALGGGWGEIKGGPAQ